jgi:drug/metabolite transporter (DMT)-like permease
MLRPLSKDRGDSVALMSASTLTPAPAASGPGRAGAPTWIVPAAVAVVLVLWASAFIAIRSAAHSFTPGPLALIRLVVGAVLLTPVALRTRRPLPRGRSIWLVLLYGLAWFGGYNVALNAAERRLDPGTSAMLVNVAPVLIALAAGWLLKEGFPRRLLIGLAVAFGGVVVISVGDGSHRGDAAGLGLVLAAAVLYAVGVLSQKFALRTVPAVQATWLGCAAAAIALMGFAPQTIHELAQARTGDILLAVYLGAFPTALGFLLWAFALSRSTAGSLGSTTLAVPAIAVLMSWVLLDQLPTVTAGIGGAICLIGVVIATARLRRPALRRRDSADRV